MPARPSPPLPLPLPLCSPHEFRGVDRGALLDVLEASLPAGSVRYGKGAAGVEEVEGRPELVLEDGSRIRASVRTQHCVVFEAASTALSTALSTAC